MKIMISPAKKMNVDTDSMPIVKLPIYLEETQILMAYLQGPVSYTHLTLPTT